MRRFTKEEIEILKKGETAFKTAKSNYKRATPYKQDEEICKIYEDATGEVLSHSWSCGRCSLTLYQKAGKKYFEDKEYYERQEEEKAGDEIVDMISTMIEITPKKTRGRKPNTKKK